MLFDSGKERNEAKKEMRRTARVHRAVKAQVQTICQCSAHAEEVSKLATEATEVIATQTQRTSIHRGRIAASTTDAGWDA